MDTTGNKQLYDKWSATYDTVENPTRDLERAACTETLSRIDLGRVLELGCGTGKNTGWLSERAASVVAADISPEMQSLARTKIASPNVDFQITDITKPWTFLREPVDLITASLVLEHIDHLGDVFGEAANALNIRGRFYVCELHPFKQYAGSKARFETDGGTEILDCFTHNVSDYLLAAEANGFVIERLDEWFDDGDRSSIPRLISFLFRRR